LADSGSGAEEADVHEGEASSTRPNRIVRVKVEPTDK